MSNKTCVKKTVLEMIDNKNLCKLIKKTDKITCVNCWIREDFPTPDSPTSTTCKKMNKSHHSYDNSI